MKVIYICGNLDGFRGLLTFVTDVTTAEE